MSQQFWKNLPLKLVSALIAVIIWIFVVGIANSVYKYPEDIEISPINVGKSLSVSTHFPSVKLYLKDDKDVLKTVTKSDFTVYVDLNSLLPGDYQIPVSVIAKNPQVRIMKIDPENVKVNITQSSEKDVKVIPSIVGKPAQGYSVQDYSVDIQTAKIKGSSTVIDKIDSIEAKLYLNGIENANINQKIQLSLPTKFINEQNNIQIVPDQVLFSATINQDLKQKKVSIIPSLSGNLNKDISSNYSINPSTVTIEADEKSLKTVDSIKTKEIDITKLIAKGSLKAEFIIPTNVNIVGGISSATISLKETNEERRTIDVPVSLIGSNPVLKVSKITPNSIKATISGLPFMINSLDSNDINVSINISDLQSLGNIQLTEANIKLPIGVKLLEFYPKQVNLEGN